MANNLSSNVSQIVLKKFAPMFMSDCVLLNTVDRQLIQGEINPNTGDTVWIKRPHQYTTLRTPGGDISASAKNNLISGKVAAKITNYATVAVEWTSLEQAIQLNQLDEILKPVSEQLVTALELELGRFIQANGALSLGDFNTPITKWGDVAQTGSMLKDIGVTGTNYAVMNPWAAQNLADRQSSIGTVDNLVRTAWEDAQIASNFGGVRAIMSNALPARTTGSLAGVTGITVSATPTVDYLSTKDTYQMTIVLAGVTNGATLKAGDQLEFATSYWLNQQNKQTLSNNAGPIKFTATVVNDVTSTGTTMSVVVSGAAIIDATNPQYNTVSAPITSGMAVTVKGQASTSARPGLFYNEKAIAMGTVELPKLHSIDSAVMSANKAGLSIRVHKYANGDSNKQYMRFDILPAFAILNPMMAGQFYGVA